MKARWNTALCAATVVVSFSSLPHAVAGTPLDRLEASVNSSIILGSDVQKFRSTLGLRQQLDPLFAGTPIAARGDKASQAEIVDFLINERLITQQFQVNDTEVEQEVNSIQANNKIDRESLKTALRGQGYKFEDYFELIRVSTSKRNLIDRDIRTKVTISDDDVKNYFYNHYSKQTSVPSAYKVRIIVVSPKNYKNAAAAREIAERALSSVRGGEAFEEVAKRVSDDPSAAGGGDLGELSSDQMSAAIQDPLKKMKIGDVSSVLGTPQSRFFILKLEDIRSQESDRLAKMKEEIRGRLAAEEYQHQIALWLERQRQSAFIHHAGQSFTSEVPAAP